MLVWFVLVLSLARFFQNNAGELGVGTRAIYAGIKQAGVKKLKKKKETKRNKKKTIIIFYRVNSCIKTTTLPVHEGWGGNDIIEQCHIVLKKPEFIEDITRWHEDMNFIFEWQNKNNILRTSAASE